GGQIAKQEEGHPRRVALGGEAAADRAERSPPRTHLPVPHERAGPLVCGRGREGGGFPNPVELLRRVVIAAKRKEVARVVVMVSRGASAARESALEGRDGAGRAASRRECPCHGELECVAERGKRLIQRGNGGPRLARPQGGSPPSDPLPAA